MGSLEKSVFASEKYFFFVPRKALRLLGFWPGSDNIRPWQIRFAIYNALVILIYAVFQINFCLKHRNNLVLFLSGCTPLVTQLTAVVKILLLVSRRRDIKKILDHLEDSFANGDIG